MKVHIGAVAAATMILLLEKYIEEPLVLTKKEEDIRCLSNVCTHRGFIIAHRSTNT